MIGQARRLLWLAGGGLSLGLAVLGAALPLLPTTPFLLLAAFCFARSSPRLHAWLLAHGLFGPLIVSWQERGAIPRRAKHTAYVTMAAVLGLSVVFGAPLFVIIVQVLVLSATATFIATRPDA
jgi:uncharacterized membrane protein YbaN (DUF454 family)